MNRLRDLRIEKEITQDDLGQMLGVQKAAVCKYELGIVPLPSKALNILCDYFGVTADYLLGRDMPPELPKMVEPRFKPKGAVSQSFQPIGETVGVPLLGAVHAGLPILANENIDSYIPVPTRDVVGGEYFYMEVVGDCMTGEFIPEGALVMVRLQESVENGRIAVARTGDEVLLRKIKYVGGSVMLIPANPKYEPIIMNRDDVEIVGRVVEVRIRVP